jgi:hypothetical protein
VGRCCQEKRRRPRAWGALASANVLGSLHGLRPVCVTVCLNLCVWILSRVSSQMRVCGLGVAAGASGTNGGEAAAEGAPGEHPVPPCPPPPPIPWSRSVSEFMQIGSRDTGRRLGHVEGGRFGTDGRDSAAQLPVARSPTHPGLISIPSCARVLERAFTARRVRSCHGAAAAVRMVP